MATFTVTTLDDTVSPGDGALSLREAVIAANATLEFDFVVFDSALFGGTVHLGSLGEIVISQDMALFGSGVTIDANADGNNDAGSFAAPGDPLVASRRALRIESGQAQVSNLTLTGGRVDTVEGGGAIYVDAGAQLVLSGARVENNSTTGALGAGGGIGGASGSRIRVDYSTIAANFTEGLSARGGGIAGDYLVISRSTIAGNATLGAEADGGGIARVAGGGSRMSIDTSTIADNSTSGVNADGGGLFFGSVFAYARNITVTGNATFGGAALGGGIAASTSVSLRGSIVTGNLAASANGDDVSRPAASFDLGTLIGDDAMLVFEYTKSTVVGGRPLTSGELRDNGGLTATVALRNAPSNPALDRVAGYGYGYGYGSGSDQLGQPIIDALPGGYTVDAGAFELQAVFPRVFGPTFIVTTADDTVNASGLSLREALVLANADPDMNTIVFDPSLAGQVVYLQGAELVIEQSVTIDGGTLGITIDANADGNFVATDAATTTAVEARRAVRVAPSTTSYGVSSIEVTFENLTITGGRLEGAFDAGGGVLATNGANLRFVGSTVRDNSVAGYRADGGGVAVQIAGRGYAGELLGTLTIEGSTISGNSASGSGGGVHGRQITLTNATIADNVAGSYGGGIYARGGLTVQSSTITANAAASLGGVFDAGGYGFAARDSIVLGNFAADGSHEGVTGNYSAASIVGGGSFAARLVFDQTREIVAGTNIFGGVLAANGGGTQTVALRDDPSNPALDSAGPYAPPLDQRGVGRFDSRLGPGLNDMGAYELVGVAVRAAVDYTLVTTSADSFDLNDTVVTLREAIAITGITSDLETIRFAAGLTGVMLSPALGELVIDQNRIAIDGGAGGITIDANQNSRVFLVDGTSATLTALTITGGRTVADNASGGGIGITGGAVLTLIDSHVTGNSTAGAGSGGGGIGFIGAYASGYVQLQGTTISGNSTSGDNSPGGGVRAGFAQIYNSTIANNHTIGEGSRGGGLQVQYGASVIGTTVTGNSTAGGNSAGGGIAGSIQFRDSIVAGNLAALGGGDDTTAVPSGTNSLVGAGAAQLVFAAITTLTVGGRSVDAGVLAPNGGPTPTVALRNAADNPALDRASNAASGVDQRGVARSEAFLGGGVADIGAYELFVAVPGPSVDVFTVTTLADTVIAGDGLISLREAIIFAELTTEADTIRFAPSLAAGLGVATVSLTIGELAITRSLTIVGDTNGDGKADITIDANADSDGRADTRADGTEPGFDARPAFLVSGQGTGATFQSLIITGGRTTEVDVGGGVSGGAGTTLSFINSTITGNSAANASGGGIRGAVVYLAGSTVEGNSASGSGGGISAGFVGAISSTIAGNRAGAAGGGLDASVGAGLASVTITGNTAATGGGARIVAAGAAITNSLIAGNLAAGADDDLLASGPVLQTSIIGGAPATLFAATATITAGSRTGLGGVLADNGGPTRTVALAADASNPAIDGASASAPAKDQRGFDRFDFLPGGGTPDIGAFELQDSAGASIVSVGPGPSVPEGAPGAGGTLLFTIERSGNLGGTATVDYDVVEGTARTAELTGGLPQTGSVTFVPGEFSKTVAVAIAGDTMPEPDETVIFNLTRASNATLGLATVTGVIRNDDMPPRSVISVNQNPTATEGGPGAGGVLVFTATRSGTDLSGPASVSFFVTFAGANPADANDLALGQELAGSFRFLSNQTSASFSVAIAGDTTPEPNETIRLLLDDDPVNATLGLASSTGTIINDDFSIVQVTGGQRLAEGDPGDPGDLNNFTFTITRSTNAGTTNVTYELAGDADPLTDLRGPPPLTGSVTFAPGEFTKTVDVPIRGDIDDENDEAVILRLTGADNGALIGRLGAASSVILDDDAPAFVSITGGRTIEGDGVGAPPELVFTVTRTGNTLKGVTVDIETRFGTADGDDVVGGVLPVRRTLTFAPGDTTEEVRVAIAGDTVDEADETIFVRLSNPSPTLAIQGPDTASATIVNDDGPARFGISVGFGAVTEGNAGTTAPNMLHFTISRDLNTRDAATVDVVLSSLDATNADLDGVTLGTPTTVLFLAGETERTFDVRIVGDLFSEPNETVTAALTNPSGNNVLGAATTASARILNDDGAAIVTVVPGQSQGAVEGGDLSFVLARSGNAAVPFTVTYVVTGRSADATSADIASPLTGSVNFAVGQSNATVTIATVDDTLSEATESFALALTGASAGALVSGRGAIVDLIDNDGPNPLPPRPTGSLGGRGFGDPHLVTHDGLGYDFMAAGEFTLIEATSGAPLAVQARFVPVPGSDVVTQTAAIATAAGGVRLMIDITAATPVLVGGVATPLASGGTLTVGDGTLYRVGDTYTFVYASGEQLEVVVRDGYLDVGVALDATRANNLRGLLGDADGDASNDLQLADGAVLVAEDIPFDLLYGAYANAWRLTDASSLFTYPAGLGTADFTDLDFPRAAISVDTLPDAIVAEAEALLDALGVTDPAARAAAIIDFALTGQRDYIVSAADAEDAAPVTERAEPEGAPTLPIVGVSAGTTVIVEGDSGAQLVTFTIFRTSGTGTLDVAYALAGGAGRVDAADLSPTDALAGTISFAADETEKQVSFTVLGDADEELDEALRLEISLAPGAGALVGAASAQTLIVDDDTPFASFAVTGSRVAEGAPGDTAALVFTVSRTGDSTGAASVDYTLGGGTADSADLALGLPQSGTLLFAPGETTRTVAVAIAGDLAVEANETLVLSLSNPSDGTAIATAAVTGTIANDDTRFTIAPLAADRAEGNAGTTAFTFTITRAGDTSAAQSVGFAVTGASAAPADATDFAGGALPTGTATFAPGQTSATIAIDVAGDLALEPDERFAVTLTPPANTTAGTPAEGIIRTDDTRYSVAAIDTARPEGDSATTNFRFTITREGDLAAATASFAVTGTGPAPADAADFAGGALPTGTAVFAAGQASTEISIGVAGDGTVEADEGFTVTLTPPTGATVGQATASARIVNDDNAAPGGTGDDLDNVIIGGPGNDTLSGLGGNDFLQGNGGNDTLDGGSGIDTVSYADASSGVTVNLSVRIAQNTIGAGLDRLKNFENLLGSAFDDVLLGDASDNLILGGAGNDRILSARGNDTLIGGDGGDILQGGVGADTFLFDKLSNGAVDIVTDLSPSAGDQIIFDPGITVTGVQIGFLSTPEIVNGFAVGNSSRALDLVLTLESADGIQTVHVLDAYGFSSNAYWEGVLGIELNYPRPLPTGAELLPIA